MAGVTSAKRPAAGARPLVYVIQKHAARRTHYDLRLEWGGTLLSWAVPQGPSRVSHEKRLAVHVEDHPVEYADFEGVIPAGNYGAGEVIIWDKGTWTPVDDVDEGMRDGKFQFLLNGYKLKGEWMLVRTKRGDGKDWLLFKKDDGLAVKKDAPPLPEESVMSGLTVEDLKAGHSRADDIRQALTKLEATKSKVDPARVKLMLAETADAPFSSPDWIFELKYDGYRLLAARNEDGEPMLISRNGYDMTGIYPELARAVSALPYERLVLDGEMVVLDEAGRPDFQRLQQRARRRSSDVQRGMLEHPVTLFVFDLLGFEGFDLRSLPLVQRKTLLEMLLPKAGPLRYAEHFEERGEEMFEGVRKLSLEGIMGKKAQSVYRGGRSGQWLKIPADRADDFVVCGYSPPQGQRAGFGSLHLGAYDGGKLLYVGRAGSGFNQKELVEIKSSLDAIKTKEKPCEGGPAAKKGHVWVKPEWVAEVRYKTWTDEGQLRHPVFVRFRDDKAAEECVMPASRARATGGDAPAGEAPQARRAIRKRGTERAENIDEAAEQAAAAAPRDPEPRELKFTHLDKVFWPEDKFNKGDLIAYYKAVSEWMLPYLDDRPLVLTRYPDGIEGKSFYQKNAPGFMPKWIRTESIWSDSSDKSIDYLVCDSEEVLLYLANLGTIPFHVWSSRVATLQAPDWSILDLDPKGAPFEHVLKLALAIRTLCDEIGYESFVKTSGSTGLHILLPLGQQCTYEQSRMLAHLIARIIASEHPDISTLARAIGARQGKVYLDYLQNRHGQLLVSPYCVRPLPGAPVSAPLKWSEVNKRMTPRKFTIRSLLKRLAKLGEDPMLPVLDAKPDLVSVLGRLAERVEEG